MFKNYRLLIETCTCIRFPIFRQAISLYVLTIIINTRIIIFRQLTILRNDNTSRLYRSNNTIVFRKYHITRITCQPFLYSSTNIWGLIRQQRNTLTLHVRSHKCTTCIIMLQKWYQTSCYRNHLFRRNVH